MARLLFVSPSYYPHIGGVEYVVKSVAERLAKKGHEVTVLCGESRVERSREELVNNVSVVWWPVWSPGDAYHIPKMRRELRKQVLSLARDCDVVHFHSVHSILTIYSLSVLRDCEVRKVLTPYYHGSGHTIFRRILWRGWRYYVKRLMRFVDIVHTVSKLESQLVKKDFNVDAIPIENGVDEWVLSVEWSPSGYVMYSGRIEKYKNIHRLANIVKILNENHGFDLELKVYGSGPYVNNLNKYLKKVGVKYSINSPQPFEKYVETLSKASIFGLLSEKESYPQSVNEANAIGVPVVAAEPWGHNFSGRSRTLIVSLDEGDANLAEKMNVFLNEVSNQSKSNVSSWDQVTETYVSKLYSLK